MTNGMAVRQTSFLLSMSWRLICAELVVVGTRDGDIDGRVRTRGRRNAVHGGGHTGGQGIGHAAVDLDVVSLGLELFDGVRGVPTSGGRRRRKAGRSHRRGG